MNSSMMLNLMALLGLALVSTVMNAHVVPTEASDAPCNPAFFCHSGSMLCKSSEVLDAILRGDEGNNYHDASSRGICTDAFRWNCDVDGLNCVRSEFPFQQAFERCRNILDTDRDRRENKFPGRYIEACREGEWTCNDGYCSRRRRDCFSGGHGGIRYSNQRCDANACDISFILQNQCADLSKTLSAGQECAPVPDTSAAACCPPQDGEEPCRMFDIIGEELEPRKCGGETCPEGCSEPVEPCDPNDEDCTRAPTPNPTPQPELEGDEVAPVNEFPISGIDVQFRQLSTDRECCCKLSCDCFGDPHCTNFFGQQQTTKVSEGSYDMLNIPDVFELETYLGDPQGIIEQVDVKVNTEGFQNTRFRLRKEQCNNRTHNWQDATTGEYISVPDNWDADFTLDAEGPERFTDPTRWNIRNANGEITAEIKCVAFLWNTNRENPSNPSFMETNRFDIQVTVFREMVDREGEMCCPDLSDHLDWVQRTGAQGYCVSANDFPLPGVPPASTAVQEGIDQFGRRQLGALAAPGLSKEKEEWLQNKVKEYGGAEAFASKTKNAKLVSLNDINERRLRRLAATGKAGAAAAATLGARRRLQNANDVCEQFIAEIETLGEAANIPDDLRTLEACLASVGDFGLGSLTALLDILDSEAQQCINDPLDSRLPTPANLGTCEEAVILQLKGPETNNQWVDSFAFPAGIPYCSDSVFFDFARTKVGDGNLNTEYSMRLKQCTPDPAQCGVCTPLPAVDNVGFEYAFACPSYDGYRDYVRSQLLEGMKEGDFECGFRFIGTADPMECLRAAFPDLEF